jgi:hypothetical protein
VDRDQFDSLSRDVATDRTRRGLLRALGGVGSGALASLGWSRFSTLTAEAKKKKKKCATPTCQVACPTGADYCLDASVWFCGQQCGCAAGTTQTICAPLNVAECFECAADADCQNKTGPGSVCAKTNTANCNCDDITTRVCLPPCDNPIPIQCA